MRLRAPLRGRRAAAAAALALGAALLPARVLGAQAGGPEGAPGGGQESGRCASPAYRRASRVGAGAVFVGANAALYEYFRRAWWSGERADEFRINWEQDSPFRGMDKLGHALGGYHLARAGTALLENACVPERRAVLIGAAYAAAFQLQIELWDATQEKYGFSPNDVVANTAGTLYAVAQHAYRPLRHVRPTVSYAPSPAYRNRASFPPGSGGAEMRPSLDYSGQTYWMSADVDALLPDAAKPFWPGILRLSVGHSITEFVAPESGGFYEARRRVLVSLDLDPTKLPGDHPAWKFVKQQLSYYHFPAPAIQIAPTVRGIAWYR